MDNKGYAFTITILIISIILISLLMFYAQTSTTKIKDTTTRITADKIHNFMENTKEDLKRATGICVKRAVVYAINDAKERARLGDPTLGDYVYNNCTGFNYPGSGSQAAIAELMLCGTLKGVAVDAMTNNSLRDWKRGVDENGGQLNLVTSVIITDIDLPLYDPWHIAAIVHVNLSVSDETRTSFHRSSDVPVLSMVSITGLEDPLYPLQSGSMRVPNMFTPCNTSSFTEKVGSGTLGVGNGGGIVYYVANLSVADQKTQITNYVETIVESQGVNVSIGMEDTVFVINMTIVNVSIVKNELNQSGGVLNYEEVAMDALEGVTVAYISGITVLDSNNRDWVALKNPDEEVVKVHLNELADTSCYQWDRLGVWPEAAAGGLIRPSFFDRLDGNLNQSQKYLSQTQGYFNLTEIGLESFVNLYKFNDTGISVESDLSWVDYLYWSGQDGCRVYGAYPSLRIDNETAENYFITDLLHDCTPSLWYDTYGPAGTGDVVQIGAMYVARNTNTAGTEYNGKMNWTNALSWAADLDWLGKTDWRLPTRTGPGGELYTIYDNRASLGSYATSTYWSSTEKNPTRAYTVDFGTGGLGHWTKTTTWHVRAVRECT